MASGITTVKCKVYVDVDTTGFVAGDIGVLVQDTDTLGNLTVVYRVSASVTIESGRVYVDNVPVRLGVGNSIKIVRYTSVDEYVTLGTTGIFGKAYE